MIEGVRPDSPDWRNLSRRHRQRIEAIQSELEQPVDHETTTFLRGQIAALRTTISEVEGSTEIQ